MPFYDDKVGDTTKRDKGTEFHATMDAYFKGNAYRKKSDMVPGGFTDVYDWVLQAIEWTEAYLKPRCFKLDSEVYVGTDFATGKVHSDPSVRDRQYPKMPGYVPGTADVVAVLHDGSLLVADWKTGGSTGADKQLLTLAVGLRDVYRTARGALRPVRLAVFYAGEAAHGQGVISSEWEVTDADLEAHRAAMASRMAQVGSKEGEKPTVGIHCTQFYCQHLAHCPGITGVTAEASSRIIKPEDLLRKGKVQMVYPMTDKPTSDEHAGYVMERVTAAKRQLKYWEDAIRARLDDGGRCVSGDFEFSKGNDGARWRKRK